jgi:hypothetical protein
MRSRIAAAIADGTAVMVSGGSLRENLMEGPELKQENRIVGFNRVPGPIPEGASYRCELQWASLC